MQITFDLHHMRDEAVIALGNALSTMIDHDQNETRRGVYFNQLTAVCNELRGQRGIDFTAYIKAPDMEPTSRADDYESMRSAAISYAGY